MMIIEDTNNANNTSSTGTNAGTTTTTSTSIKAETVVVPTPVSSVQVPTATPFLHVNDKTIYFNENWDVGIGGGLWSNGLSLSKFFIDHPTLLRNNFEQILLAKKNKNSSIHGSLGRKSASSGSSSSGNASGSLGLIRAIELGSGNGLLSCCLAAVVGDLLESLFVTDLADHLDLMKQTVISNSHFLTLQSNETQHENNEGDGTTSKSQEQDQDQEHSVKCHVVEHAWGENMESLLSLGQSHPQQQSSSGTRGSNKFDFIFGSDVAYRDYLHEPLISSLSELSDDHTISIIGVTMTDTKPTFFTSLTEAGFRYEKIPDHLMSQEFRGRTFGLFVIQKNWN